MQNNEDKTGIKSIETNEKGRTVVTVTDTKKFGEYLENKTEEFKMKNQQAPAKQPENDLKIYDVSLNPLHLACLDDDDRPNLKLIEVKNNIATATNGSLLVKMDLTVTSKLTPGMIKILNGKFIHMHVWKEIVKCDSLELDDQNIICNKLGINKIFEYSMPQGEFFKIDNMILDIKESGPTERRVACYSSNSISIISDIFKTDDLNFSFTKGAKVKGEDGELRESLKGTVVFPYSESGMFAILMPRETVENRYMFI